MTITASHYGTPLFSQEYQRRSIPTSWGPTPGVPPQQRNSTSDDTAPLPTSADPLRNYLNQPHDQQNPWGSARNDYEDKRRQELENYQRYINDSRPPHQIDMRPPHPYVPLRSDIPETPTAVINEDQLDELQTDINLLEKELEIANNLIAELERKINATTDD